MTVVGDELAARRAGATDGVVTDGVVTGAEPLGDGAVETQADADRELERLHGEAPPADDPGPKLLQEALPGDWETISSEFGGAIPEFSEIRLLGGKMPIEGSFAKGTEFDVVVRCRVTGVLGLDVTDDYGRTTRTLRRHMARMVSVKRFGK